MAALVSLQAPQPQVATAGAASDDVPHALAGLLDSDHPIRRKKRSGINILSLDGGGVRGLSTCELLIELQKALGPQARSPLLLHRCFLLIILQNPIFETFDLIGGASTGGFISVALLAGLDATECRDMYINMSKKVFDPQHKGLVPKYNANILVNEIKTVCEQRFHDAEAKLLPSMKGPRVFCISTQAKAEPVKPFIFRNYAFERGATSPFEGCDSAPIWEAARATSAAPYYFASYDKPMPDGNMNLIDGGVLTNNPVQVACEEAVRLFSSQRVNCIVSVGTGLQSPPEKQHNKSLMRRLIDLARASGLSPIIDRLGDLANLAPMLIDIVTGSEMTHDLTEPLATALGVRYYRLNAPVPATNLADCSDDALGKLQSYTKEYIAKHQDLFHEISTVLLEENLAASQERPV